MSEHSTRRRHLPWQLGIGHLFNRVRDAVVVGTRRRSDRPCGTRPPKTCSATHRTKQSGCSRGFVPLEFKHSTGSASRATPVKDAGPLIDSGHPWSCPRVRKAALRYGRDSRSRPRNATRAALRARDHARCDRASEARSGSKRSIGCAGFVAMWRTRASPMASVQGFAEHLSENWDALTPRTARTMDLAAIEARSRQGRAPCVRHLGTAALENGQTCDRASSRLRRDPSKRTRIVRRGGGGSRFQVTRKPSFMCWPIGIACWQVLSNVFANALMHSAAGNGDRRRSAKLAARSSSRSASETGPGIPEADRDGASSKRSRQADAHDPRSGSVGLGLYVRASASRVMDGRSSVEPPSTRPGAEFVITLPARRSPSYNCFSPRASISTNCFIRRSRVSCFFAGLQSVDDRIRFALLSVSKNAFAFLLLRKQCEESGGTTAVEGESYAAAHRPSVRALDLGKTAWTHASLGDQTLAVHLLRCEPRAALASGVKPTLIRGSTRPSDLPWPSIHP